MKPKWCVASLIWNLCVFAVIAAGSFVHESIVWRLVSLVFAGLAAYNGERAWRELLDAIRGDETDTDHNSQ